MHVNTIVKVKANSEKEAIEIVNDLLTDSGSYNSVQGGNAFDYVCEDDTKIAYKTENDGSEGAKFTEMDFADKRKAELKDAKEYREKAARLREDTETKGYYLECAGELLQTGKFWCTHRRVYDYTQWQNGIEDLEHTYYIETNRHC